jgi:uncharacterized membrane protein YphA (DoxX/SURF4 family)
MNNLTRFFLVLLRLAIGWMFLFEGIEKVQSVSPWTSAAYLQQSYGPLGGFFHWQAGGSADEMALERFTLKPLEPSADPGAEPVARRVSPALREDYEDLIRRYAEHYGFSEAQVKEAHEKLERHLETVGIWLQGQDPKNTGEKEAENAAFGAPYRAKRTFRQRLDAYRAKVAEIRRDQDEGMVLFGKDVFRAQLRAAKADAARMRGELLADLEKPLRDALDGLLTDEQAAKPRLQPPSPPALLRWTDAVVSYGLFVVGAGLLLGLLTRLNCLAGALFLITLYLAMPSWPWLPENLRTEGHYLFVSKNLVLALALLTLATTHSGRWFGLDGLVYYLGRLFRRAAAPRRPARVGEKVSA